MSTARQERPPMRSLLTHSGYLQWSAAVQLMRMPSIMTSFAFVLVGGNQIGGLMITAYILCSTFFAIPGGRLIDRIGVKKGAPFFLLLVAGVLTGIVIAAAIFSEGWLLILFAGLTGALMGGIPGAMRSLLSRTIPQHLLASAIAFDATVVELVVVSAPLIAAAAAIYWVPGAVGAMVVSALMAAFLTWRLGRSMEAGASKSQAERVHSEQENAAPDGNSAQATETDKVKRRQQLPEPQEEQEPQHPQQSQQSKQPQQPQQSQQSQQPQQPPQAGPLWWLNRRFVFWMLLSIAFGHALGTAEVGALPIVRQYGGSTGAAAAFISVLAVSSAASGLAYAFFSYKIRFSHTFQAILFLFVSATGCIGLAFSANWVTMAISMIVIGMSTAPLMTVRSLAVEQEIPEERKAEGFSIMNVSHTIGFSLGGFLLSIMPLSWMVTAGGVSGMLVLLSAFLLIPRSGRGAKKSRSQASYSEVP
ncbi:MFS transporter [Brevibacillus ruminantium]|uniref:MFS transporter n=1 Tax=Brevibacillus ruminantium TaxID=2950604 RepID=A0ABY4WIK8_9BACL|nr:MFS transporter [Brevibacillus ruminantium]USG66631.1 MFS transporter [Brevibacillus ruminantium]